MRKPKTEPSAPLWVMTYADMMSLLLCLFILIASMSEVNENGKFQQALESIRAAFGYDATVGPMPIKLTTRNSLLQQLQHTLVPRHDRFTGDSEEKGIRGRQIRVTDVREGIRIEIGGQIAFERFSAVLAPEAEAAVAQIAGVLAGHNSIIKVTAHATNEPLPPDSPDADAWALSYARARAVADALVRHGVSERRLRLEAAGYQAPLEAQAYDEETRALNRRVEIVATEALVNDYAGRPYSGGERG